MEPIDVAKIDYREEFAKVADHWAGLMPMMLMEECGELIQAVSKNERKHTVATQDAVLAEMADVCISIGAVMAQMGLDPLDLAEAMDRKLLKQY